MEKYIFGDITIAKNYFCGQVDNVRSMKNYIPSLRLVDLTAFSMLFP